ncbi:MAG: hypothetical protein M3R00_00500 [Pseudomonadota bacterium]|nr:hypothetical protein [Pseudomonadota bacterium]
MKKTSFFTDENTSTEKTQLITGQRTYGGFFDSSDKTSAITVEQFRAVRANRNARAITQVEHVNVSHSRLRTIPAWKWFAVISFAFLFYLPNAINLDAFLIKELFEYLYNDRLTGFAPWIIGCAASAIPDLFWMICIVNILLRLDEDEFIVDGSEEQIEQPVWGNKWYDLPRDVFSIGLVTGLITFSGFIDTVDSFITVSGHMLPPFIELLPFALTSAGINGFAELTLHRRFMLMAVNRHDVVGDWWITRFGRTLLNTYIINVWTQPGLYNKLKAAYIKYGILAGAWLSVYYATDVSSEADGLKQLLKGNEWILNTVLATLLALVIANTKALNVDTLDNNVNPRWPMKLVLCSASAIHALPATLQAAKFLEFRTGPFDGLLYNLMVFAGMASLLIPSYGYGFYATVAQGALTTVKYIGKRVKCCRRDTEDRIVILNPEDMITIGGPEPEEETTETTYRH